ncbi:hypothetical protein KI387_029245 [Taxus chinensis]|uniref:Uncharacterized protein n=1 Tax=Taxus chinensis TaxID=29808 RepID=A0AA38FCF9_TAXCH|nr:hypothetical protein KI387_029245 [Taxus chinensis]
MQQTDLSFCPSLSVHQLILSPAFNNPNSNGHEDSVIQSIPIFSYREQDDFFACAICLNEFQEGMPCLSPLENGYHVSSGTSINIDLSDQKGKEVAKTVFSKSPIISKLTHASSLKDLRTGSQCYWEGNIQRAYGMSPPEQRKQSCTESMQAMRR